MARLAVTVAALFAATTILATGAAANHSGPEDVAKGRGATEVTVSGGTASISGVSCLPESFIPIFSVGEVCVHVTQTTAQTFDFDAVLSSQEASTPLGEPHGHMKLSFSRTATTRVGTAFTPITQTTTTLGFTATADVTCLTVVNNKATLSGRVTKFAGDVPPQRGLFFDVTDNTIARQQVAPDQFAGALQPEALQVCPAPTSGAPLTRGDILVEDN